MEKLAEQPPIAETETIQKSFDMTASARALRHDLDTFGDFQFETEQQVLGEELSLVVEGIGRASRTSFIIKRDGNELVYFFQGEWQSYDSMVERGREVAIKEAEADFRRSFLVDMRNDDVARALAMRNLTPGQKMSWTSAYRHDIEDLYGSKFMDDCGLVSSRKMGFLYQATCLDDGSVLFESQTLDRSEADAFALIDEYIERDPNANVDDLMDAHDAVLTNKYGQEFHAGRTGIKENAWKLVLQQDGLKNYLLDGLKEIARSNLRGKQLDDACKKHIYGVWATFKEIADGNISFEKPITYGGVAMKNVYDASTEFYVMQSLNKFIARGEVMVGCGGAIEIKSEADLMNAELESVFKSIFKSDDCEFVSIECPKCHKKNVKTVSKNGRYHGACGCSS